MSDAQRPRVRPWLRHVAIVALIVLIPVAAVSVWDLVEARRLSAVVEAIRARGETVYYSTYVGPTPPPEEQAAARYYTAAAVLARDATSIKLREVNDAIAAIATSNPHDAARDPRLPQLQRVLDDYAPMLDLLDRASALDTRGVRTNEELRYAVAEVNLANVNAVRIARLSFLGDSEGAAKALSETLKLRNVSFLWILGVDTRSSLRALLTFAPPDAETLARLQDQYEQTIDEHQLEKDLIGSRARLITAVWPGALGPMATVPRVRFVGPRQGMFPLPFRPTLTRELRQRIIEYDEALPIARLPWPEKLGKAKALADKYQDPRLRGRFGMPPPAAAFLATSSAFPRNIAASELGGGAARAALQTARQGVAVAVLAIERYRRAHAGAVPPTLEALVPQYLKAVPTDPYTGTSLKFVRVDQGYKVYSVAANRTDDGGDWSDVAPGEMRPLGAPSVPKDLGMDIRKF